MNVWLNEAIGIITIIIINHSQRISLCNINNYVLSTWSIKFQMKDPVNSDVMELHGWSRSFAYTAPTYS